MDNVDISELICMFIKKLIIETYDNTNSLIVWVRIFGTQNIMGDHFLLNVIIECKNILCTTFQKRNMMSTFPSFL